MVFGKDKNMKTAKRSVVAWGQKGGNDEQVEHRGISGCSVWYYYGGDKPRMDSHVNYGLLVTMMRQYRLVSGHKCTNWWGCDMEEAWATVGGKGHMGNFYTFCSVLL